MREEDGSWTVGALADAAGISVRTLRHYEQVGLVRATRRTAGGHRRYGGDDVARLFRVLALRDLGIPLADMPPLMSDDDPGSLAVVARARRQRVEEQVAALRQLAARLDAVIDRAERADPPDPAQLMQTLEAMTVSVHLSQIYTRTGDDGSTELGDRTRALKTSARVEALGAVDELNAAVGAAWSADGVDERHRRWLRQVQNDLFDVGAALSTPRTLTAEQEASGTDAAGPEESPVQWLERCCDAANRGVPPVDSFVLPGTGPASAALHVARTICRRAERRVLACEDVGPATVQYLNRLSDLLFILARASSGADQEPLWNPRGGDRTV